MSANRTKLVAVGLAILAVAAVILWLPIHAHNAAVQAIVDQTHSDAADARAAADSAADSAARTKASAQDVQNRAPGSS